jgi:hypothetical protein
LVATLKDDFGTKGVNAWTERFSHIDDHFMGRRGLARQGIQNWFPVESGNKERLGMIRVARGCPQGRIF